MILSLVGGCGHRLESNDPSDASSDTPPASELVAPTGAEPGACKPECGLLRAFAIGNWSCNARKDGGPLLVHEDQGTTYAGHGACLLSVGPFNLELHKELREGDCACDAATGVLRCSYIDATRAQVEMACAYRGR